MWNLLAQGFQRPSGAFVARASDLRFCKSSAAPDLDPK